MKMLDGAAKEAQGELAENERVACIPAAPRDTQLAKLTPSELRAPGAINEREQLS